MSIKYKNNKGLNEKKSNQGSMNFNHEFTDEQLREEYFGSNDQEKVEEHAGDRGETSGESFDKYPQ